MSEETNNVLVVISLINDEYRIKYNPLIPNKILIDALEVALEAIKEGKAETKVSIDVKVGEQSHNEPHKKARF